MDGSFNFIQIPSVYCGGLKKPLAEIFIVCMSKSDRCLETGNPPLRIDRFVGTHLTHASYTPVTKMAADDYNTSLTTPFAGYGEINILKITGLNLPNVLQSL